MTPAEQMREMACINDCDRATCRALKDAADRLERMEAVVEAARAVDECWPRSIRRPHDVLSSFTEALNVLSAALDALQKRSDTGTNVQQRSCPNAVSWCEGPDRYEDICKACIETWTEEAKEKNA